MANILFKQKGIFKNLNDYIAYADQAYGYHIQTSRNRSGGKYLDYNATIKEIKNVVSSDCHGNKNFDGRIFGCELDLLQTTYDYCMFNNPKNTSQRRCVNDGAIKEFKKEIKKATDNIADQFTNMTKEDEEKYFSSIEDEEETPF